MLYKETYNAICDGRIIKNLSKENFFQSIYSSLSVFQGIDFDTDTVFEKWCKGLIPVGKDIIEKLYTDKSAFSELSKAFYENLNPIRNKTQLVSSLNSIVEGSTMLTRSSKDRLMSIYNPKNEQSLTDFIAACLVISNICSYNKQSDNAILDIDFNFLKTQPIISQIDIQTKIWSASLNNYRTSHEYGNRFYALNIIENLLPKGVFDTKKRDLYAFEFMVRTKEQEIKHIDELIEESQNNIALTGVGGIGKTSCLQKMLYDKFGEPDSKTPPALHLGNQIPFYIELNKCPLNIMDWFDPVLHKTNFITRYIAASIEGHMSLDSVSDTLLHEIEKELQKNPETQSATYFLYLDGFNEVHPGHDRNNKNIRYALSNEITLLSKYKNVRILTTTRPTQSDIFSRDFERVTLEGLSDDEIISYLSDASSNITKEQIGIVLSNRELMKCLRVPLFLCMFAEEDFVQDFLPETTGEILYNFFHKNESRYNLRRRNNDIYAGILSEHEFNIILDFILPYIGWKMYTADVFSINNHELGVCISECVSIMSSLSECINGDIPFPDFNYNLFILQEHLTTIASYQNKNYEPIIQSIHEYMSVMYQFNNPEPGARYNNKIQHAFVHHHFRDYFCAIWIVQLLKIMQSLDIESIYKHVENSSNAQCIGYYINNKVWHHDIAKYIGEILLEAHNRPYFNHVSTNWELPSPLTDEQQTLTQILDYCRTCCKKYINVEILIHNIVDSIYLCREELTGVDLSELTLYQCNLFNIQLSRRNKTDFLSANFKNSGLSKHCLNPVEHLDDVSDYIYMGDYCYTLDTGNVIKVWDIETGTLLDEYHDNIENGLLDYRPSGYLRVSNNGRWIATMIQPSNPESKGAYILLYDTTPSNQTKYELYPPQHHKTITDFIISDDSKILYVLFDKKYLCVFNLTSINTPTKEMIITNCLTNSKLFDSCNKNEIFIFTGEYSYINSEEYYDDYYDDSDNTFEENDNFDYIENCCPCSILRISFITDALSDCKNEIIYSYVSPPNTTPFAYYSKNKNGFVIYNANTKEFELFNCTSRNVITILEDINAENSDDIPGLICNASDSGNDIYVIYSTWGYISSLDDSLMHTYSGRFNLADLKDEEGNSYEEIYFQQSAHPRNDHFILRSGEYTYEWIRSKDIVTLKYNTLYYNCIDFIPDIEHDRSILIHAFNGINIFSNSSRKMYLAYRNYPINSCVIGAAYDERQELLALLSESTTSSSEYVMLCNLSNGEQNVIFSSYSPSEIIKSISFSKDGNLLIVTTGSCLEYNTTDRCVNNLNIYLKNEILITGKYKENDLHIVSYNPKKTRNKHSYPLCRIYKQKKDGEYMFHTGYYLPILSATETQHLVTAIQDYGNSYWITDNEKEIGQWVTEGFFLNDAPNENVDLMIDTFKTKTATKIEAKPIENYKFLFVLTDFMLGTLTSATLSKSNQYSYIDSNFNQCIMLKDKCVLCQYQNITTGNKPTIFDYTNNDTYGISNAFFDIVIPTGHNYFYCLGEGYHVYVIDSKTGQYIGEIPYDPGVLISGCDFSDTSWLGEGIGHNINNDFHIHNFIHRNGGIMK